MLEKIIGYYYFTGVSESFLNLKKILILLHFQMNYLELEPEINTKANPVFEFSWFLETFY
jgi:hypothetical protein